MLELTTENALGYLQDKGWINPGPARIKALGWGVSNLVLRVEAPDQLFVLKQSRPQLRTRDAWFSNVDRVYREQEVMTSLLPLLPPGTVPKVLFSDRENYVFLMSHAPPQAKVWKEALLAGQVDLELGGYTGRILGMMHESTATRFSEMEAYSDKTVFIQLRVEPFYYKIQQRMPEVKNAVAPIVEHMIECREALCHGDYSPKNILTLNRNFTLVDYETAHLGDPTMDLGFFLSHLVLKAFKRHETRAQYFKLTERFWEGYAKEIHFRPLQELQARGIGHFAVCILARIHGTSPVEYLTEEPKREAVRSFAIRILLERPQTWNEVLGLCERQMAQLN